MRILVVIIAILALPGGMLYLVSGALSVISGVLMMTAGFTPEIAQTSGMSPTAIGPVFYLVAFLMTINGISLAVALFPNPGLVSDITNYVTPMDPISRLPLGVTLGKDIAVESGYESQNPCEEAIEDHKTPNVAPDVPFPVRIR